MGADVLATVCRTENASISWLLEGKGAPFLVHRAESDQAAAETLERFITDEPAWSVHQIQGPNEQWAFALTQPAKIERKGEWIDYTELELIVGDVGERARAVINDSNLDLDRHWITFDANTWHQLQAGLLGTWRLVGDDKHPGLLTGGDAAAAAPRISEHLGAYATPLSNRARALGRWFDQLPAARQAAVLEAFGIDELIEE